MVKYKKRRSRCAGKTRKACNDKKHKRRCRMTKRGKEEPLPFSQKSHQTYA